MENEFYVTYKGKQYIPEFNIGDKVSVIVKDDTSVFGPWRYLMACNGWTTGEFWYVQDICFSYIKESPIFFYVISPSKNRTTPNHIIFHKNLFKSFQEAEKEIIIRNKEIWESAKRIFVEPCGLYSSDIKYNP